MSSTSSKNPNLERDDASHAVWGRLSAWIWCHKLYHFNSFRKTSLQWRKRENHKC